MAIEPKWEPCERPSLDWLSRMVLVSNWTTVWGDDRRDYELYYDYATGQHYRQETTEDACYWARLEGHRLSAVAPKWAQV